MRENWIDFVCLLAVIVFGLFVGFVGCDRSAGEVHEAKNSDTSPQGRK